MAAPDDGHTVLGISLPPAAANPGTDSPLVSNAISAAVFDPGGLPPPRDPGSSFSQPGSIAKFFRAGSSSVTMAAAAKTVPVENLTKEQIADELQAVHGGGGGTVLPPMKRRMLSYGLQRESGMLGPWSSKETAAKKLHEALMASELQAAQTAGEQMASEPGWLEESIEKMTKEQMASDYQALQNAWEQVDRTFVAANDRQTPLEKRMEYIEKMMKEQMASEQFRFVLQTAGEQAAKEFVTDRVAAHYRYSSVEYRMESMEKLTKVQIAGELQSLETILEEARRRKVGPIGMALLEKRHAEAARLAAETRKADEDSDMGWSSGGKGWSSGGKDSGKGWSSGGPYDMDWSSGGKGLSSGGKDSGEGWSSGGKYRRWWNETLIEAKKKEIEVLQSQIEGKKKEIEVLQGQIEVEMNR